jgi:hypothetical protein
MIDNIDVQILICLSDYPGSTTTTIAKKMFEPKDRQDMIKCDSGIRNKLKKLIGLGLVEKSNGGKALYSLSAENVFFGGGKFNFPIDGGKKVHVVIDDFIAVRDTKGNFYIHRLNPVEKPE